MYSNDDEIWLILYYGCNTWSFICLWKAIILQGTDTTHLQE